MEIQNESKNECRRLTRYLVGEEPTALVFSLYHKANERVRIQFSPKDERLWKKCMSNSFVLYCVDSALALGRKDSPIRKRILVLFSILECDPALSRHFLPLVEKKQSLLNISFIAIKAGLAAFMGKIFLFINR